MKSNTLIMLISSILFLSGCAGRSSINYENEIGRGTVYEDPNTSGRMSGVGMESQDVVSMTDEMMRDMLSNEILLGRDKIPRVIIDAEFFRNESTNRINKNMLTDRLRVQLNRAARGRLAFIGRHFTDMVAQERGLKRDGAIDAGTIRTTNATAGGDFRLGGRITSLNSIDKNNGMISRYTQVTFEMVDLELNIIIWSGIYEFKKTAQDNLIYR